METIAAPASKSPLIQLPAWRDLEVHSKEARTQDLRALFGADAERGRRMTAERAAILDFNCWNTTEKRVVLYVALRMPCGRSIFVDSKNYAPVYICAGEDDRFGRRGLSENV